MKALADDEPDYFAGRDAVLVMDDDLEIDAHAINTLFELRRQSDAWILQPAYDNRYGKSSHNILRSLVPAKSASRVTMGVSVAIASPHELLARPLHPPAHRRAPAPPLNLRTAGTSCALPPA